MERPVRRAATFSRPAYLSDTPALSSEERTRIRTPSATAMEKKRVRFDLYDVSSLKNIQKIRLEKMALLDSFLFTRKPQEEDPRPALLQLKPILKNRASSSPRFASGPGAREAQFSSHAEGKESVSRTEEVKEDIDSAEDLRPSPDPSVESFSFRNMAKAPEQAKKTPMETVVEEIKQAATVEELNQLMSGVLREEEVKRGGEGLAIQQKMVGVATKTEIEKSDRAEEKKSTPAPPADDARTKATPPESKDAEKSLRTDPVPTAASNVETVKTAETAKPIPPPVVAEEKAVNVVQPDEKKDINVPSPTPPVVPPEMKKKEDAIRPEARKEAEAPLPQVAEPREEEARPETKAAEEAKKPEEAPKEVARPVPSPLPPAVPSSTIAEPKSPEMPAPSPPPAAESKVEEKKAMLEPKPEPKPEPSSEPVLIPTEEKKTATPNELHQKPVEEPSISLAPAPPHKIDYESAPLPAAPEEVKAPAVIPSQLPEQKAVPFVTETKTVPEEEELHVTADVPPPKEEEEEEYNPTASSPSRPEALNKLASLMRIHALRLPFQVLKANMELDREYERTVEREESARQGREATWKLRVFTKLREVCRAHRQWVMAVRNALLEKRLAECFRCWKLFLLYRRRKRQLRFTCLKNVFESLKAYKQYLTGLENKGTVAWYYGCTHKALYGLRVYAEYRRARIAKAQKALRHRDQTIVRKVWRRMRAEFVRRQDERKRLLSQTKPSVARGDQGDRLPLARTQPSAGLQPQQRYIGIKIREKQKMVGAERKGTYYKLERRWGNIEVIKKS